MPEGALRVPDYVDCRVLAQNTNETHTVPEGAHFVFFSADANFYASYDGDAAVVPGADVTDGTSNELNPTCRYIGGVSEIDLITPATAAVVTMAFFK
jgi:hypothetical protein